MMLERITREWDDVESVTAPCQSGHKRIEPEVEPIGCVDRTQTVDRFPQRFHRRIHVVGGELRGADIPERNLLTQQVRGRTVQLQLSLKRRHCALRRAASNLISALRTGEGG